MLILLQPGIEPLGQFDIEDDDIALVKGGEVGVFESINFATDGYAGDVLRQGPPVHISLDNVDTDGVLYGLVDEGTAASGVDAKGYGTRFGSQIGGIVGIGTGVGSLSTQGVVVIGPSTIHGSGKVTLWTKPGLYGVTRDAWAVGSEFDSAVLNGRIYGSAADGTYDGKLTTSSSGADVALVVGRVSDTSLVSTSVYHASGGTSTVEHIAIYLLGVQS